MKQISEPRKVSCSARTRQRVREGLAREPRAPFWASRLHHQYRVRAWPISRVPAKETHRLEDLDADTHGHVDSETERNYKHRARAITTRVSTGAGRHRTHQDPQDRRRSQRESSTRTHPGGAHAPTIRREGWATHFTNAHPNEPRHSGRPRTSHGRTHRWQTPVTRHPTSKPMPGCAGDKDEG